MPVCVCMCIFVYVCVCMCVVYMLYLCAYVWIFVCVFVCGGSSMTQKYRSKEICLHFPFSLAQGYVFLLFFCTYQSSYLISLFPTLFLTSQHRGGQISRVTWRSELRASDTQQVCYLVSQLPHPNWIIFLLVYQVPLGKKHPTDGEHKIFRYF